MPYINTPVVANLVYNFVWHTKSKSPILIGHVKRRAHELLREACSYNKIAVLGGNVGTTHVYMQLSCPARLAPSEIMRLIKGRSSRYLQSEFPSVTKTLSGESFWNEGYYCQTVGEDCEAAIRKYIGRDDGL